MPNLPVAENEMERLLSLSEFDLDYAGLQDSFKDLAKLAAKVAGTEISLVNPIDSFTQWTVSSHGLKLNRCRARTLFASTPSLPKMPLRLKTLAQMSALKINFM